MWSQTLRPYVFSLIVCISFFTRATSAQAAETFIDISRLPQGAASSIRLGTATVTGSADVRVGDSTLGIGENESVNPGEFIEFTFDSPVYYINIQPGFFFNKNDQVIEGWGPGDVYLGSVFTNTDAPNYRYRETEAGISMLFGNQPVTRIRITPVDNAGMGIATLRYHTPPLDGKLQEGDRVAFNYVATRTLIDSAGCPADFVGKFSISARLSIFRDIPLSGLEVRVASLTNGNLLLDPTTQNLLGGVGAVVEVPKVAQYSDGILNAGEAIDVPFVVCLRMLEPFEFFVNVFAYATY